jgi:hypothetical protein
MNLTIAYLVDQGITDTDAISKHILNITHSKTRNSNATSQ